MIKFSHKFHQKEVETACADCHTRAEQSTLASDNLLPAKEECQGCHEVEDEEACTLCHFEDEETRQPLPAVENTLLFNHEFHVLEQKVACETCHKNLDRVDYADDHSKAQMPDCARCHNNQQATLECVNCHTNTLTLRPVDHSSDYLVTHKNLARIDQEACSVCHTRNDCAECHQGASLFMTASAPVLDTQTPMFPSLGGGTKGLLISRVHDLNFRLTHPLEAQGRSQECAVCHETQNFCQTCHEAEGVDVAGKPVWHGGPDWGALAGVVGTGGGRHAELARRDIENCAACHSTEGDDPTCLLCHTDFDGVQGTNPKTHETGFADQIGDDASLHDDDNALCYSCHTNTRQAGAGFCGYCHEAQ
ncbi:MAG: cytochrome C [bacterium]